MLADELREVVGTRGERIVELCLTDYRAFKRPLFRLKFLGDKWPSIDFYAELRTLRQKAPYFFAQAKATSRALSPKRSLIISCKKEDIAGLLRIPGPTYIFGIHEPTQTVFVRSVHKGVAVRAITRIPLENRLTDGKLLILHDEVKNFWMSGDYKPRTSVFK